MIGLSSDRGQKKRAMFSLSNPICHIFIIRSDHMVNKLSSRDYLAGSKNWTEHVGAEGLDSTLQLVITARQGSCGKVIFSVMSVCSAGRGPYVTIIHDALDFPVQGSSPDMFDLGWLQSASRWNAFWYRVMISHCPRQRLMF